MDPKACLDRILNALCIRDFETAREASNDLHTWLVRGGFYPHLGEQYQHEVIHALLTACLHLPTEEK